MTLGSRTKEFRDSIAWQSLPPSHPRLYTEEAPMSTEQRENLDAILRQSAFPFDSDVNEQRRQLRPQATASVVVGGPVGADRHAVQVPRGREGVRHTVMLTPESPVATP